MTLDQLVYVLERVYKNIKMNDDVLVSCNIDQEAFIYEWKVTHLESPSKLELEHYWNLLSDQYHAETNRRDSKLYHYLNNRTNKKITKIL